MCECGQYAAAGAGRSSGTSIWDTPARARNSDQCCDLVGVIVSIGFSPEMGFFSPYVPAPPTRTIPLDRLFRSQYGKIKYREVQGSSRPGGQSATYAAAYMAFQGVSCRVLPDDFGDRQRGTDSCTLVNE